VSLAGGRAEIRIGGEYSTAAWSDYRTKLQNALSAGAAPEQLSS
jgi:hypothetical protein